MGNRQELKTYGRHRNRVVKANLWDQKIENKNKKYLFDSNSCYDISSDDDFVVKKSVKKTIKKGRKVNNNKKKKKKKQRNEVVLFVDKDYSSSSSSRSIPDCNDSRCMWSAFKESHCRLNRDPAPKKKKSQTRNQMHLQKEKLVSKENFSATLNSHFSGFDNYNLCISSSTQEPVSCNGHSSFKHSTSTPLKGFSRSGTKHICGILANTASSKLFGKQNGFAGETCLNNFSHSISLPSHFEESKQYELSQISPQILNCINSDEKLCPYSCSVQLDKLHLSDENASRDLFLSSASNDFDIGSNQSCDGMRYLCTDSKPSPVLFNSSEIGFHVTDRRKVSDLTVKANKGDLQTAPASHKCMVIGLKTDSEQESDEQFSGIKEYKEYNETNLNAGASCSRKLTDHVQLLHSWDEVAAEPNQGSLVLERSLVTLLSPLTGNTLSSAPNQTVIARQKVLEQCEQTKYIPFDACITHRMMENCVKIGEGVYGEVFRTTRNRRSVALKVLPIEGDFNVNDEPQKTFGEILQEIVISRELSALRNNSQNTTSNFVLVNRVSCVQGAYPAKMLVEWDKFHEEHKSWNDRPGLFNDQQLFIVFEFGDGGTALECFKLKSIRESWSIIHQVALSLAVAEADFQFEHRDLHWGNVLVRYTDKPTVEYTLRGKPCSIESAGVMVTVIDFTLSRLCKDGCTVYCDLATDESLFQGGGDYQFDIYRKMKEENGNNWETYNPHSNVLWIHYLADKLLHHSKYTSSKENNALLRDFRYFTNNLLDFNSAVHLVNSSDFIF